MLTLQHGTVYSSIGQDVHITKVLADIQVSVNSAVVNPPVLTDVHDLKERDFLASSAVMQMTTGHAKHGFPVVPELDLARTPVIAAKKKKSLFAEQFESKDMAFFGIESTSSTISLIPSERDFVEPIFISQVTGRQSLDRRPEDAPEAGSSCSDMEHSGGTMLKDVYSSTASETWDRSVIWPYCRTVNCRSNQSDFAVMSFAGGMMSIDLQSVVHHFFCSFHFQSQVEVELYLWGGSCNTRWI